MGKSAVPKSLDSIELWQSCLRKNPRTCYTILLQSHKKGNTSPVSGLTCVQWRKTTPCDCLEIVFFYQIRVKLHLRRCNQRPDLFAFVFVQLLVYSQFGFSPVPLQFTPFMLCTTSLLYHGVEGLFLGAHGFQANHQDHFDTVLINQLHLQPGR